MKTPLKIFSFPVKIGPATLSEQVEAVRKYALARYNFGWDTVVEGWDDQAIEWAIKGASTCWGAIDKMRACVVEYNAYSAEIVAA